MTWPPKFAVCHSYYDRFRFRSDAFAGLYLALQIKGRVGYRSPAWSDSAVSWMGVISRGGNCNVNVHRSAWSHIIGVVYPRNISESGGCRFRCDVPLRAGQQLISNHELADRG